MPIFLGNSFTSPRLWFIQHANEKEYIKIVKHFKISKIPLNLKFWVFLPSTHFIVSFYNGRRINLFTITGVECRGVILRILCYDLKAAEL